MNELANKIQIAMNTIQTLDIKATFDNANHLMGALTALAQVRDELRNQNDDIQLEIAENGAADAQ